jgi:hypothetical protein
MAAPRALSIPPHLRTRKQMQTKMQSITYTAVSAANTSLVLNDTVSFDSTTFPEKTALQSLFEEFQFVEIRVHYKFGINVFPTPATKLDAVASVAVVFDPNHTNPITTYACLENEHHKGPLYLCANSAGDKLGCPFDQVSAKFPKMVTTNIGVNCPGNSWFNPNSSTSVQPFNFLAFATSLGPSGLSEITYQYELTVNVRNHT